MSSPALPAAPQPQRFNHLGWDCPLCMRPGALAIVGGFYYCRDGCATWFRFLPETADRLATLERLPAADVDALIRARREDQPERYPVTNGYGRTLTGPGR